VAVNAAAGEVTPRRRKGTLGHGGNVLGTHQDIEPDSWVNSGGVPRVVANRCFEGACGWTLKPARRIGKAAAESHGRQPDSGNPTVRDETGGLRKRGRYGSRTEAHWEINGIATGPYDVARTALLSQPFGTGFAARRRGRKEQAVFLIHQRLVELEQCCRLDERAKLRNPARTYEWHGQSEHEAIERRQVRRPLPGSITDQKLMFEQKRLCGHGAYATGAEQLRECD